MTRPYLILVLQAPLLAYGSEAVDQKRPTDLIPGRSMLTGLIGNALAYGRRDADKLASLQRRVRYAARTEPIGQYGTLRDFQTAQLDRNQKAWTTYGIPEQRAGGEATYRAPEIREVDYLADSRSVVAITLAEETGGPTLTDVAEALQNPARPLFIGRKCCIPERPIFEALVDAGHETEALYYIEADRDIVEAQVQWDGPGQHDSIRKDQDLWVSDLKDWRNGVHVGRRLVNRGTQRLPEQADDRSGA